MDQSNRQTKGAAQTDQGCCTDRPRVLYRQTKGAVHDDRFQLLLLQHPLPTFSCASRFLTLGTQTTLVLPNTLVLRSHTHVLGDRPNCCG